MLRSLTNKTSLEARYPSVTGKPHEATPIGPSNDQSLQANEEQYGFLAKEDFKANEGVTLNRVHREQMGKGLDNALRTLNVDKIRLNLSKKKA